MPGWQDEPLGAFGVGSNVPTGEWFPVDTQTGAWQLPGVQAEQHRGERSAACRAWGGPIRRRCPLGRSLAPWRR